jgi:hypothetical protein
MTAFGIGEVAPSSPLRTHASLLAAAEEAIVSALTGACTSSAADRALAVGRSRPTLS